MYITRLRLRNALVFNPLLRRRAKLEPRQSQQLDKKIQKARYFVFHSESLYVVFSERCPNSPVPL